MSGELREVGLFGVFFSIGSEGNKEFEFVRILYIREVVRFWYCKGGGGGVWVGRGEGGSFWKGIGG